MLLLAVPAALLAATALLGLAGALERRQALVVVRLGLRSTRSPEEAEALVAAELAPVLSSRRP